VVAHHRLPQGTPEGLRGEPIGAAGYTPNTNLTVEQLPPFKEFMEKTFERSIPGIAWIERGFKEINGVSVDLLRISVECY
jgi:hypothetical protein